MFYKEVGEVLHSVHHVLHDLQRGHVDAHLQERIDHNSITGSNDSFIVDNPSIMNLFKVELINFAHRINCNLFSVVNFKTSAESRPERSPENRM